MPPAATGALSDAGGGRPPTARRRSWLLAPDLTSVGAARVGVRRFLEAARPEADLDAAVLAVSELVANAVQHARPGSAGVALVVSVAPGAVRVEVHDDDPGPPVIRQVGPAEDRGRGLAIVARLADRWGWGPEGGGKRVWCDLAPGPRLGPPPSP